MHAEITDLYFMTEQQKAQISELHRALVTGNCSAVQRALLSSPLAAALSTDEPNQERREVPRGRISSAVAHFEVKLGPNR